MDGSVDEKEARQKTLIAALQTPCRRYRSPAHEESQSAK
jgi:hypothetical protein